VSLPYWRFARKGVFYFRLQQANIEIFVFYVITDKKYMMALFLLGAA
jgi:hypothetical protein